MGIHSWQGGREGVVERESSREHNVFNLFINEFKFFNVTIGIHSFNNSIRSKGITVVVALVHTNFLFCLRLLNLLTGSPASFATFLTSCD